MSHNDPTDDPRPRLVELPSPFPLEPGTLRMFGPAAALSREQLDQLREGTPARPFLIDHGQTRSLFFNLTAVQSSMRLDDPHALIAPYTRKMMAFLLFLPTPRHVLMIGLGGGSLAKFCYRHLPHARITVVEINADIIALRDEFLIPPDDERFEIVHDDGAAFMAKSGVQPDVVLIDAFDEVGISPSLASADFCRSASRCMSPEGVLVMNLSGLKSRYTTQLEQLRAAFPVPIRLVPVEGDDNFLLFAGHRPEVVELPDSLQSRAAYLEQGLGLEFSRFLERLRAGHLIVPGGESPV